MNHLYTITKVFEKEQVPLSAGKFVDDTDAHFPTSEIFIYDYTELDKMVVVVRTIDARGRVENPDIDTSNDWHGIPIPQLSGATFVTKRSTASIPGSVLEIVVEWLDTVTRTYKRGFLEIRNIMSGSPDYKIIIPREK